MEMIENENKSEPRLFVCNKGNLDGDWKKKKTEREIKKQELTKDTKKRRYNSINKKQAQITQQQETLFKIQPQLFFLDPSKLTS